MSKQVIFTVDIHGNTISLSPGNHNVGKSLALLHFDLYKPEKAKRIII